MREKSEIIDAIRETARKNEGTPLGRRRFEQVTGITESDCRRYWPRWSDAVAEAGLAPNRPPDKLGKEHVLRALAAAVRHFETVPTMPELNLLSRSNSEIPNVRTIAKYFPSKADWIAALRHFCEESDDLRDVLAFLPEDCQREEIEAFEASDLHEGYVYLGLLSIGREKRYKIGKATNPDRRMGQIELNLPEKMELVHMIETDDAYGIEGYWHRRFKKKCTNGEWFRLDQSDVRAFKKRKRQ